MMNAQHAIRKHRTPIQKTILAATLGILLFASAFPHQAAAQSVSVGSTAGLPGSAVDLTINFSPGTTGVATLQFDLGFSSALTPVFTTTGTAASNAGKSASGSAISGGVRVIIFGMNQTVIGAGSVCVVRFNIASGTLPATLTVAISNVVTSDPQGGNVPSSAANGSITVTAPPDTTPPDINGIVTSGITYSSATISWITNEASNTQLDYGITSEYGSNASNGSLVTSHTLQLTGLTADTFYHFRVKSSDAAANQAVSGDFTFRTAAVLDVTPPDITAISISAITHDSATISWITNEPADTQLDYGTHTGYGSNAFNTAMVTSHVQHLSNLTASTLYHYRVKSADAAGNQQVSADMTFTTAVDTDAPVISNVLASGITTRAALITWTTDENSDSQVEYGLTVSYGSSTAIDSEPATSHHFSLSGLTAETVYHYRVKSRDAAGYLATSGDYIFATSVGNPPVPENIANSNVTMTSATITWTTPTPSDSQVEYGTSTAYGNSTQLDSRLVTSHSQALTGLVAGTLYHYRVKSRDSEGDLRTSGDKVFLTQAAFTMFYPRLLTASGASTDSLSQQFIGLGIANLDSQATTLRFTAYDASGAVITRPGITNPASLHLNPGQQAPVLDYQLFGTSLSGPDAVGWVKIESDVTKIAGFFMMFNEQLSELDGADFNSTPVTSFILSEIRNQGYTKISVGNPNPDPATLTFSLIGADGIARATATRNIPGNGALVADLITDIFPADAPDSNSYVKVTSNQSVLPFELLGTPSRDFESLYGQDATLGAPILYCPQYVVGGAWSSAISIINLEPSAGYVTMRMFGDDAIQVGATRAQRIEPYGKILIDSPSFFEYFRPDENPVSQGFVKIESNGVRLAGSVVFGDRDRSIFSSALPLSRGGDQSVVYGHIAADDQYYTGVAIVNPDRNSAQIVVDLYDEDGTLAMTKPLTIPAGARVSQLLTQLFPQLASQHRRSGYLKVTSDVGIASIAVFGTNDLSLLAAIPPQIIR